MLMYVCLSFADICYDAFVCITIPLHDNGYNKWPKHVKAQTLSFVQYLETKLVCRRKLHGMP
jgi:hypothetical protein